MRTKALALSRWMEATKKLDRPVVAESGIELAHVPDDRWVEALELDAGRFVTVLAGWSGTKREEHDGVQIFLRDRQAGSPSGNSEASQLRAWIARLSPDQVKDLLTPSGLSTASLDDSSLWGLVSAGGLSSIGVAQLRHRADSNVGVMGVPYVEFVREGRVRRIQLPGTDPRTIPTHQRLAPVQDWRTLVPTATVSQAVPGELDFGTGAWKEIYEVVGAAGRAFDLKLGYDFRLERAEVFAAGSMGEEAWLKAFRRLVTSREASSAQRSEADLMGAQMLDSWFRAEPASVPLLAEPLTGLTSKDFLEGKAVSVGVLLSQNPHLAEWARQELNLGPDDRVRLGLRPVLRVEAPGDSELPRALQAGSLRVVFANVGFVSLSD